MFSVLEHFFFTPISYLQTQNEQVHETSTIVVDKILLSI